MIQRWIRYKHCSQGAHSLVGKKNIHVNECHLLGNGVKRAVEHWGWRRCEQSWHRKKVKHMWWGRAIRRRIQNSRQHLVSRRWKPLNCATLPLHWRKLLLEHQLSFGSTSATHQHLTHILDYSLYLNLYICLPAAYVYPDTGNCLGLRSRLFQRARFYHCQCSELLLHHENRQKTDFWFYYDFSVLCRPCTSDGQHPERTSPILHPSTSLYCHLCHFFTGLAFAVLPYSPHPGAVQKPTPQSLIPHLIWHQHKSQKHRLRIQAACLQITVEKYSYSISLLPESKHYQPGVSRPLKLYA